MCGIAGTFELVPGAAPDEQLVAAMTDALAHRGPDDAGVLVDAPACLGNRRLAGEVAAHADADARQLDPVGARLSEEVVGDASGHGQVEQLPAVEA